MKTPVRSKGGHSEFLRNLTRDARAEKSDEDECSGASGNRQHKSVYVKQLQI